MIEIAKIKLSIRNKNNYKFYNQEELSYKLDSLNKWCYVFEIYIICYKLGAGETNIITSIYV